jgi:hypothetical protein
MGLDTFTVKSYHITLTCDACNHVEEYMHEENDKDNLADNIDNRSAKRREQLCGWNYSYHKIEPVWDAYSRFDNPELKEMTRTLLCPTCSEDYV